ncbi:NAC domain-containing protein 73-like isoform X2 [Musa acuminata AAA Group]|uniref:(wild Malaysian banana) hypothetical protein n=1 Tax=Musa acuminata subsp. malaccensis TaxID=214687 RepID=A0A804JLK1_MUSAM|nr:PREDICTED: NAC domain-containing protein 73 isoform X2 [Musa acuminata subsp. malaccensis]CAG1847690.1 unnamed protein product [Musa acuminata subsp. malaccensis]
MVLITKKSHDIMIKTCPSCGHRIQYEQQQASSSIQDLPGLPAGVKFDPTDQELLEHLEGKTGSDPHKLHPLIDEFIPTIEGDDGICYTHPEKLPRVRQDGLVRHFFHRPSKAYTTGTRKRRKVHTDARGGETRWHKTGKTRPVSVGGKLKGYKKILVLYTNYGKQRKPEKTSWIMHQYHLGSDEEEKDGELVVSKVFYQTQPRQCGSGAKDSYGRNVKAAVDDDDDDGAATAAAVVVLGEGSAVGDYYAPSLIGYNQGGQNRVSSPHLLPNFAMHTGGASFLS